VEGVCAEINGAEMNKITDRSRTKLFIGLHGNPLHLRSANAFIFWFKYGEI
jgi:hypothetical protein